MFNFKIDTNAKKIEVQILKAPATLHNGIRRNFYKLGKYLVKTASEGIKKSPKVGKRYYYGGHARRGKKGFWTRASAEGSYFANQTGKARKALGFEVVGYDKMHFGFRDIVKYPKFLEEGTRKMAARPALKLTVLSDLDAQYKIMRDANYG